MEYQTIVMAGLLHDIGKFLQKGKFGNLDLSGSCSEVSVRFIKVFEETFANVCDKNILAKLASYHHELAEYPDELMADNDSDELMSFAYLISRADKYSYSEHEEKEHKYHDYKTRPLDSVLCRLEIGKELPQMLQYKAGTYIPKNGFPEKIEVQKETELNKLLQDFLQEFSLTSEALSDFWKLYNRIYSLLMKYTWCIPSNAHDKIADISLFEHLKTTSAIVACLYQYHEYHNDFSINRIKDDNEQKFNLLAGDLSGIQSYLLSGANIGDDRVAKRLRARSFIISIISELASQQIINKFNLPVSNVLMSSGDKFYILLPNTEEIEKKVKELQTRLDNQLLQEFQGEIAINIVTQEMSGSDFSSFGTVVALINQKLAIKKRMPFNRALQNHDGWLEESFIFDIDYKKGLDLCHSCGKEFVVSTSEECEYGEKCFKDMEIGGKISRLKELEFVAKEGNISLGNESGVNLITENDSAVHSENLFFSINDTIVNPEKSLIFRYLANYIPLKGRQTMLFDEIAEQSIGIKRLAVLKADVDNLDQLFALGLKGKDRDYDSISRVTTLSRMLDLFFSGCVNELVKTKFPHCYIIYSVGDDLLVVGPWNEIIDFAMELQKKFIDFSGSNKNVTISAGISINITRLPIAKATESAEELLEISKEKVLPGREKSRNQVTVFNRTLSWLDLSMVHKEGNRLISWTKDKKISKSELWKLRKYDDMYQDFVTNKNIMGLSYKVFLAYQIGRTKKEGKTDRVVIDWLETLFDNADPKLQNLGVMVDYALSAIREGASNE